MMLRDYIQKAARRVLRLPKKPAPEPAPEVSGDTVYHPPADPLPEPQRTPPMPRVQPPLRRPARAAPSEEDDL